MTFSCIKIKRKFRMKFGMPNYSVEAAKPGDAVADNEEDESGDVARESLQEPSRALSKSASSASAASDSSCLLDTTSGQTSSSPSAAARPQRDSKSSCLPPPPYVPSLDSMPSLPNASTCDSFAAIDSATTHSACFISHVFSSRLWQAGPNAASKLGSLRPPPVALDLPAQPPPATTKSSISHSSSSGKISDASARQQGGLVSRLITNRIDRLIGRGRHSAPAHSPPPSALLKSPRNQQLAALQQQHQQAKLYERINLKSKVKEHLYSPLHFEAEAKTLSSKHLLHNFQQTQDKARKLRDDLSEKKRPLQPGSNKRGSYNAASNGIGKRVLRPGSLAAATDCICVCT